MYAPYVAVVTNVEADHLDNYGTEAAYRASFAAFLGRIKPGGVLVTCADDPGTRDLAAAPRALGLRVVSYGESADADYRVTGVATAGWRRSRPPISAARHDRAAPDGSRAAEPPRSVRDESICDLHLRVPGHHNALNAAAAFAAAGRARDRAGAGRGGPRHRTGAPRGGSSPRARPAASGCSTPTPTTRPSSPPTCARPARSPRAGGCIAVFQPHLYSRTRIFAAEFGAALGLADEAVVLDVYAAREDPEPGVTGGLVADAVPGGDRRATSRLRRRARRRGRARPAGRPGAHDGGGRRHEVGRWCSTRSRRPTGDPAVTDASPASGSAGQRPGASPSAACRRPRTAINPAPQRPDATASAPGAGRCRHRRGAAFFALAGVAIVAGSPGRCSATGCS